MSRFVAFIFGPGLAVHFGPGLARAADAACRMTGLGPSSGLRLTSPGPIPARVAKQVSRESRSIDAILAQSSTPAAHDKTTNCSPGPRTGLPAAAGFGR